MLSLVVLVAVGTGGLVRGPCDSLPGTIKAIIAQRWGHARLPDAARADSEWRRNIGNGFASDGHPYCVTGEFDGKPGRDFVLLLQDSLVLRVVAFHSVGRMYSSHLIQTEDAGLLPELSLFRIGPMTHADLYENGAPLRSRHDAVEVVDDETSSWTLVWDGKRYRTFWTSD